MEKQREKLDPEKQGSTGPGNSLPEDVLSNIAYDADDRRGVPPSRVVLVGCGRRKAELTTEHERTFGVCAKDLYTGALFVARKTYAESQPTVPWFIVSAGRGLLLPDELVKPYDVTLADLAPLERAAWYLHIAQGVVDLLPSVTDPDLVTVELHAGALYAERLAFVLRGIGFAVEHPVARMNQGAQLALYKERRNGRGAWTVAVDGGAQ